MEQHLDKKDYRLFAVCVAVVALSLYVATHFFHQAFPEATIDFKITREEAREQARSFLQHRGLDVEEYRHSAIFRYDGQAKTFLERELGLQGATATIGDPVRLWRWSNRWVKELQKEEFQVEFTTAGELVGFAHLIEEELEGARLAEEDARYQAEQFLAHTMDRPLADLTFVEAETTERPHRTDHYFTWKLSDFEVEEATYRLRVGIQGDLVGSYTEYLKVPEAWQREYSELRSHNMTAGLVAGAFMMLTAIAMLVFLAIGIRQQDVRWKTVIVFSAIAFALTFLSQLNQLPITEFGFDTTETYGSFLTESLLFGLLGALAQALFIGFAVGAAEPLYRRSYPDHISVEEQFLPDGIRTKRFLIGTIIGLTLTVVFVAYETVFYTVADKLGAWSPAQIPYDEMVNTYIPWVVVLLIGFMPAVSEEFTSRAFSIPLLQRFMKHRWIAVVLSAVIWGFAHSGYPQQPFYLRGIEVGLVGIAFGYVMIRWGLLPVLVCHYTYDALLTAMILLRSSNDYFVISAAVSVGLMLLPLAAGIALYVRHRFFIDPTSLLNREDTPATPLSRAQEAPTLTPEAQLLERSAETAASYSRLPTRRLLIATAVVAGLCVVFLLPYDEPLEDFNYALTADAAETAARDYLAARSVETASYRTVTTTYSQLDQNAIKYRMERIGLAAVESLYEEHPPVAVWQVRFFRPLEKEEYLVHVDPRDGAVTSVVHKLEEEAPGADLASDQALALAAAHLGEFGLEAGDFELKESSSEKMKERRDHTFIWEALPDDPRNVDESYFRCQVRVLGDEASDFGRYIKLPEEWLREREESTTFSAVLNGLNIALFVAVGLHLIWLLVRQIRGGAVGWRLPVRLGITAGALFVLGYLNGLPTYYASYSTEMTIPIFTTMQLVGAFLGIIGIGLAVVCYLGVATALYPDCLARLQARWRAAFFQDAVWLAALAWLAQKAVGRGGSLVAQQFPEYADPGVGVYNSGFDTVVPAFSGLMGTLGLAALMPITLGIVLYYVLQVLRKPSYVVAAIGAWILISQGDAFNAGEFYLGAGMSVILIASNAAVIAFLLRDNIVAYILLAVLTSTLDESYRLIGQTAAFYQIQGWIWLGVVAVAVVAAWIESRRHLHVTSAAGSPPAPSL